MLSFLPASAYSLVAGGVTPVSQQMRSTAVNMALDRPIRVAVIGGGPSGACAAEIFAKVSHSLIQTLLRAIRTVLRCTQSTSAMRAAHRSLDSSTGLCRQSNPVPASALACLATKANRLCCL